MADYATGYGTNVGQSVVDYGLTNAQNSVPQTKGTSTLPAWYGSQMQGPINNAYTGYVANPNQYQAQNYDQLRTSLSNDAKTAYDRSLVEGDNRYGANGLYGSQGQGLQSDYMGQAQKTYQQGLMNADTQANAAADASNQFAYKAGATDAASQQAYNTAKLGYDNTNAQNQIDYGNNQLASQYNYDYAKNQDTQANAQKQYENYLALATGANPNTAANLSAATSAANTKATNSANNTNSLYTGLGTVTGGLLSNSGTQSALKNLWNSATSSGGGNQTPYNLTNDGQNALSYDPNSIYSSFFS